METTVNDPSKDPDSDASAANISQTSNQAEPWPPSTAETLEEWCEESCRRMEELSRNEALRREVSKRLS